MSKGICDVCGKDAELMETGECIDCFHGTVSRFGVLPYDNSDDDGELDTK